MHMHDLIQMYWHDIKREETRVQDRFNICSLICLVGLCALSVNHSNSYLAYPGSATIGEITVYDANSLVRPP